MRHRLLFRFIGTWVLFSTNVSVAQNWRDLLNLIETEQTGGRSRVAQFELLRVLPPSPQDVLELAKQKHLNGIALQQALRASSFAFQPEDWKQLFDLTRPLDVSDTRATIFHLNLLEEWGDASCADFAMRCLDKDRLLEAAAYVLLEVGDLRHIAAIEAAIDSHDRRLFAHLEAKCSEVHEMMNDPVALKARTFRVSDRRGVAQLFRVVTKDERYFLNSVLVMQSGVDYVLPSDEFWKSVIELAKKTPFDTLRDKLRQGAIPSGLSSLIRGVLSRIE